MVRSAFQQLALNVVNNLTSCKIMNMIVLYFLIIMIKLSFSFLTMIDVFSMRQKVPPGRQEISSPKSLNSPLNRNYEHNFCKPGIQFLF